MEQNDDRKNRLPDEVQAPEPEAKGKGIAWPTTAENVMKTDSGKCCPSDMFGAMGYHQAPEGAVYGPVETSAGPQWLFRGNDEYPLRMKREPGEWNTVSIGKDTYLCPLLLAMLEEITTLRAQIESQEFGEQKSPEPLDEVWHELGSQRRDVARIQEGLDQVGHRQATQEELVRSLAEDVARLARKING